MAHIGLEGGDHLRIVGTELDDERSVFGTALKCICPTNFIIIKIIEFVKTISKFDVEIMVNISTKSLSS